MPIDYAVTLAECGFTDGAELHDTIAAFDYEICGVLSSDDSPFDFKKSKIVRQPENLNCLLYCSLYVKPDWTIHKATDALMRAWCHWFAYTNPKLERIERTVEPTGTVVRILTISQATACTIEFRLTRNGNNHVAIEGQ